MSSHAPRPAEQGRSTQRIVLEILVVFAVPSLIIFLISLLWK